jgi:hypothetical protein
MTLQVQILERQAVAWLPFAPEDAEFPALSYDPAVQEIHEAIARLHLLGFVAVHGPPPQGVALESIYTGLLDQPLRPAYVATTDANAPLSAKAWLEAFRFGLGAWSEAAMVSPVTFLPAPGDDKGRIEVRLTSPSAVLAGACARLAFGGRCNELRRLSAYLGSSFPARFNPDDPAFVGRRTSDDGKA